MPADRPFVVVLVAEFADADALASVTANRVMLGRLNALAAGRQSLGARCDDSSPLSVRAAQFLQPLSLFDYDVADVRQFRRPLGANPGGSTCRRLSKALEWIESLPTGVASTER